MAPPHRKLPTDRTIAFAAAIVSSKPADLSVREYIALLNRHIAKGRRENVLSAAYRHLDRSAYWRAECERAKDACRAAEDARLDALHEVDVLKAKLEIARSAAGLGAKRKRADADVVPYSRELKKGRQELEEKREVFLGGIVIEEVEVGEDDFAGVHDLMRDLYQIGLHFKPGVQVDSRTLAQHLCSAAADVANVVLDALGRQEPSLNSTNCKGLSTTLTAAGRIVAASLAGFQKLLRVDGSGQFQGQVTYALVQMYDRLLTGVEVISKAEANAEISHDPSTGSKRPKTKGGTVRVNIKDVPALNALTGLLSGILKQLDANQPSHNEVFEGMLSCILSKLGTRLYTTFFSRHRGASVAAEIESIRFTNPEGEASTCEKSKHLREAHLEAPYTIHLLKQALSLAPSFLIQTPANVKSTKSKPTAKLSNVTKSSLSIAVKERLQATLVNAVFGAEGLGEESDLLLNSLQMPQANGPIVPVPRVKEVEVGEWFQGEVWRLLGWEVLGKEIEAPSTH